MALGRWGKLLHSYKVFHVFSRSASLLYSTCSLLFFFFFFFRKDYHSIFLFLLFFCCLFCLHLIVFQWSNTHLVWINHFFRSSQMLLPKDYRRTHEWSPTRHVLYISFACTNPSSQFFVKKGFLEFVSSENFQNQNLVLLVDEFDIALSLSDNNDLLSAIRST